MGPQAKINRDELRSSANQLLEKVTFKSGKFGRERRSLRERLRNFNKEGFSTEKITKIHLILSIIALIATGIIWALKFFS